MCLLIYYLTRFLELFVLKLIQLITFKSSAGKAAPGFGIGALEEYDAEDEDVYAVG